MENITAYAGVTAFIIMALFNFTIQAIPAMFLFIVYAAITTNNASRFPLPLLRVPVSALLVAGGIYAGVTQWQAGLASATGKEILSQAFRSRDKRRVTERLEPLAGKLKSSKYYWTTYGSLLFRDRDYPGALEKFRQAATLSSEPGLLLKIAACYQHLGQSDSAILFSKLAVYLRR